jgi:hypothetical protein
MAADLGAGPRARFALPAPKPPPYDPFEWQRLGWSERMHLACCAWALDGYGAPLALYAGYVLKVLAYVASWIFFCSLSDGIDGAAGITSWMFTAVAFQKAVLWSLAFEGLGLGCGSGPLTGRYLPPVAAPWHFLMPGTIKLPLIAKLPLLGRSQRGYFDVVLYALHYACLLRALCAPAITPELLWPTVVLLPLLGLSDKTIFLAARGEHYFSMLICFCFVGDWIGGAMAVQLAIWWWAAISKLNRHFPAVIGVMTSNSPFLGWKRLRQAMYRRFPDDLRPSGLARVMAHGGTAVELSFPLLLVLGRGGTLTIVGLVMMVLFHCYITSHFPMAVPLEWNVMVVYGGVFLFSGHAGTAWLNIGSPVLIGYLFVALLVVPAVGNIAPSWVSFLMSMRYYAGNWAYSVWLFKGDADAKLDAHIRKVTPLPIDQLSRFYDERTVLGLTSKIPAFRAMHLHGRALGVLLPRAIGDSGASGDINDIDDYRYYDGEILAGLVLGYNFGDGHLHDAQLLETLQAQCHFAPGELRHVFVESQPIFRSHLRWQIRDAADGLLEEGTITVRELLRRQPWDCE